MEDWLKDKTTNEAPKEKKVQQTETSHNTEKSEPNLENFETEELIAVIRRLVRIFRVRDEEGLSPIVEPEIPSRLLGTCTQLEESMATKNTEEVVKNISRLAQLFDSIGQAPRSRTFREDSESLSRLIFSLRAIQENLLSLRNPVLGEDLNKLLRRIGDVVEQKWLVIAKQRDLVRAYESRRY